MIIELIGLSGSQLFEQEFDQQNPMGAHLYDAAYSALEFKGYIGITLDSTKLSNHSDLRQFTHQADDKIIATCILEQCDLITVQERISQLKEEKEILLTSESLAESELVEKQIMHLVSYQDGLHRTIKKQIDKTLQCKDENISLRVLERGLLEVQISNLSLWIGDDFPHDIDALMISQNLSEKEALLQSSTTMKEFAPILKIALREHADCHVMWSLDDLELAATITLPCDHVESFVQGLRLSEGVVTGNRANTIVMRC